MFRFRRPSRPTARLAVANALTTAFVAPASATAAVFDSLAGRWPMYGLPTTDDTGLGAYLGTCDLYFTGDIDDVAVFNQALPVDGIWSKISSLFLKPLR
jgi:hypothetical protein